jgi:negative regulator of flagellin synthesis FlgM
VPNKISGLNVQNSATPLQGSGGNAHIAEKTPTSPATVAPTAPNADQATFTGPALALQKLSAAIANVPVVNSAKVASIKQAVQNGSYTVNAGSVADKLLQTQNELKN